MDENKELYESYVEFDEKLRLKSLNCDSKKEKMIINTLRITLNNYFNREIMDDYGKK